MKEYTVLITEKEAQTILDQGFDRVEDGLLYFVQSLSQGKLLDPNNWYRFMEEAVTNKLNEMLGGHVVGIVRYCTDHRYRFKVQQPIPGKESESFLLTVSFDPSVELEQVMKRVYSHFRYLLQGTESTFPSFPVVIEDCTRQDTLEMVAI